MYSIYQETIDLRMMRNTNYFYRLVNYADKEYTIKNKLCRAISAANYATSHALTIYSCRKLEDILISIANSYKSNSRNVYYKKNSFLHILTEAYPFGGHTRCVERWIENTNNIFSNDVVILKQNSTLPSSLKNIINKYDGNLIILKKLKLIHKALKLRNLALKYEYIVLHCHPNDIIPMIAFGYVNFPRPIILFNHADHIFWLGVSISDCVADLNNSGHFISSKFRDVTMAKILGIPLHNKIFKNYYSNRSNYKVILSSGSKDRFYVIDDFIYYNALEYLLDNHKDIILFIFGTDKSFYKFSKLSSKYCDRILFFKRIPFNLYNEILSSVYFLLDTYPIGGGTNVIDCVSLNIPVLTFNKHQQDFLINSSGLCASFEDFITKSTKLINDLNFRNYLSKEQKKLLIKFNGHCKWMHNLYSILSCLPKQHRKHVFCESRCDFFEFSQFNVSKWIQKDIDEYFSLKNILKHFFIFCRDSEKFFIILFNKIIYKKL